MSYQDHRKPGLTVFGTEGDKTRTRGGIFVPVHYLSF